jgi:NSS family neurotransmitter:Na+ symporter
MVAEHLFCFRLCRAAVGLGNLWRFPYMAYDNGGAAFPGPVLDLPSGRGHSFSPPGDSLGRWGGDLLPLPLLKRSKSMTWIGWWVLINSMVIVFYYCVVLSWCVQYFVFSFTEAWGYRCSRFFTGQVMHLTSSPMELGGLNWGTVAGLAVTWIAIFFIVASGTRGLSRVLLVTVPLPLVILLVSAFRSIGLPGAGEG